MDDGSRSNNPEPDRLLINILYFTFYYYMKAIVLIAFALLLAVNLGIVPLNLALIIQTNVLMILIHLFLLGLFRVPVEKHKIVFKVFLILCTFAWATLQVYLTIKKAKQI